MRRSFVFAALGFAAIAAPVRPADACINGVQRVVDVVNQSVRKAEGSLARGSHQRAIDEIFKRFPEVLEVTEHPRRAALFARAQRVVALAAVRSGGRVRLGKHMSGETSAKKRAINLAWATLALRLHHARSADVVVAVELAEALAARPEGRAEAHQILQALGDVDVLPTARGWALLADLEQARGDTTAALRATRRCQQIDPKGPLCETTAPTA